MQLRQQRSLPRYTGLVRATSRNVKGVGAGVFETRIDFGPGYRVYFGKDGDTVIVLLGGSVKKDQADAIGRAIGAWVAYKASKRLLRK
jgi:putative addiction module killer protein